MFTWGIPRIKWETKHAKKLLAEFQDGKDFAKLFNFIATQLNHLYQIEDKVLHRCPHVNTGKTFVLFI